MKNVIFPYTGSKWALAKMLPTPTDRRRDSGRVDSANELTTPIEASVKKNEAASVEGE